MKKLLLPVFITSLSFSMLSCAASFDCAKAASNAEKLICSNPEISKLDEQLASSYKQALESSTDKDAIKRTQVEWLKLQRACKDTQCLTKVYQDRISSLKGLSLSTVEASSQISKSGQSSNAFGVEIPKEYFGHWINSELNPEGLIIQKNVILIPYYDGTCTKNVVEAEPKLIKHYSPYKNSYEEKNGYLIKLKYNPSKNCGALSEEMLEMFLMTKVDPDEGPAEIYVNYLTVGTGHRLLRGGSGKFDPEIYCNGSSSYSLDMCEKMKLIKIQSEMAKQLDSLLSTLNPLQKSELLVEQKKWVESEGLPCLPKTDREEGQMAAANATDCTIDKYSKRLNYLKSLSFK